MQLTGRVALITGGARRLGQALAIALAGRRALVAFSYRTSAREARATAEAIRRLGVDALAVRADVSKADDVRRLIRQVEQRFGRLDVLVNSAANFERVPFARLSERHWDRAMETNLKGPFLCALEASRLMRKRAGGKFINFADWSAIRP